MGFDLALDIAPGLLSGGDPIAAVSNSLLAAYGGVGWYIQDSGAVAVATDAAYNGTHTAVTLRQPGPNGQFAGLYDGLLSYTDIYTALLNTNFPRAAGSIFLLMRRDTWPASGSDNAVRFLVDANNFVDIFAGINTLVYRHVGGGTTRQITKSSVTTTNWIVPGITWASTMKAYYNGAQEGATQTGAGTIVGNLASNGAIIGASSTSPGNVWEGYLAYVLLLFGEASAADALRFAQAAGVV